MVNPRTELFEFVLAKLENEPIHRKVRILRALSHYAGEAELTNKLTTLAADLEAAEKRCREFAFQFQKGNPAHDGGGK